MIDQAAVESGNIAIEVRGLTKDFSIHKRSHGTLKAQTISMLKQIILRDPPGKPEVKRALDNVSFTVREGEVVALMGRNGSGKSTLLSILSRIYLPTEGEVSYRGRLASLLELGVGFNPELTGTENAFFTCRLRGLTAKQVADRFQDLMDFAELDESTLAEPMRMYSSGMQARLAFATAIFVDADIILIDEALAVGDDRFQQKCLDKIHEFKDAGKTIIIVAHSHDLVSRFAERAIWLNNGKLMMDGPTAEVIAAYTAPDA